MKRMSSRRPALGWPCRAYSLALLASAVLLAAGSGLRAQEPLRLWAAQTGPDQVTLAWDAVPGAAEYRIHIGDPDAAGPAAARRAVSTFSASGRGAVLPLRRITAGLWLVVVGQDGRPMGKAPFNAITPVRGVRPVGGPASATATVTGPEEVTLSWDAVPGATAYMIARAVAPSGFQMLCALCSTDPTYVDRDITPGVVHSYTVAAVYPGGVSERARSNTVIPGAVAAAEATPGPTTPLPTLPTTTTPATRTYTPPGQPAGTTPSYTPPGQPAGTMPTYTPPGQPAGTVPTYTPPGQPAGTMPTYTPLGQPTGTPPSTTAPATDTLSPAARMLAAVQESARRLAAVFGPKMASTDSNATGWDAPVAALIVAQAKQYAHSIAETFGPSFAGQPMAMPDTSSLVAQILAQAREVAREIGQVAGPAFANQTGSSTQPHAATPVYAGPCRLDYQRADNMWAAFGRPDGGLGVETITVADGQTKVFVTDWKYEKQRNDGRNYYGSHLRIATNPGQRPVKLQVRSVFTAVRDMVGAIKGANGNYYLPLAPGKTQQFQADLVEVSCTN